MIIIQNYQIYFDSLKTFIRYIVNLNASLTWDDARKSCQNVGADWDLAILNNQAELDKIVKIMNCPEVSVWIGETDRNGHLVGVDGKIVDFEPWDMHSNIIQPGANDAMGIENCIKLRGNVIGKVTKNRKFTVGISPNLIII